MKTPVIMAPHPATVAAVSGGTLAANVVTPNPKEVWTTAAAGAHSIIMDLGADPGPWDSVYVGFIRNLGVSGFPVALLRGTSSSGPWTAMTSATITAPGRDPRPRHAFLRALASTQDRYALINIGTLAHSNPLTIGVLAAGLAWSPVWGMQAGAGRRPIDTGQANRLLDGSWGINVGAVAKAFQCEFADLSESELLDLERLVDGLGETKSVLLVENPDTAEPGINERIHWGLFRGLDFFERRIGDSSNRWAFRIEDWAG